MFKLNLRDFLKGALMAVLVPVLYIVQTSLDAGELTFNWKQITIAAIAGFTSYLLKNLFTDEVAVAKKVVAQDRIQQAENPKP